MTNKNSLIKQLEKINLIKKMKKLRHKPNLNKIGSDENQMNGFKSLINQKNKQTIQLKIIMKKL